MSEYTEEEISKALESYRSGNRAPWVERCLANAYDKRILQLEAELRDARRKVWEKMQGFRDNIYLAHTCSEDCPVCSIIHKFDEAKAKEASE